MNSGRSFKNAVKYINNSDNVNFRNYGYFYELTYEYNHDIKTIINETYLNFIYFALNKEDVVIKGDDVIIHNFKEVLDEFIKLSPNLMKKKNWAAILSILDLLSSYPKPGKYKI